MNMQPVESSNLSAAGYDATTKKLRIQFKNGSIYEYSDVAKQTYDGLLSAESAGKYFTAYIRNLPFVRIGA